MLNRKFEEEIVSVAEAFPDLRRVDLGDYSILSGYIKLYTEDGGELIDEYQIEIHPRKNYPNVYPWVYEVGGRLPHNIDWHVYPDGHWCIGTPTEEELKCAKGINLLDFISDQVKSFLYNQVFRRENGYFYRERSHGLDGRLEYYKEFLSLKSIYYTFPALKIATNRIILKSNSRCFCDSKRKYRKCHRRGIRHLSKHAAASIEVDYKKIEELLKKIGII